MEIKKGNLNFDQTGRAYPDNPHIKENWVCIWEYEDKYYKLVGDINNKEWEEVQVGEDPIEEAANKWVFETNGNKWSNNDDTAGDNYGSFKAGAEWMEDKQKGYSEEDLFKILLDFVAFPHHDMEPRGSIIERYLNELSQKNERSPK
jgi:hypothetical protein